MRNVQPAPTPEDMARAHAERVAIDASCRRPVLVWYASAVAWLLIGSALALVASFKMHMPDWLTGAGWLTFGRVRPAHLSTVVYGWGSMAGIASSVWMMCRLARVELRHRRLLTGAAVVWNVGIAVGAAMILAGYGTGVEWLDMPRPAPMIIAVALLTVSGVIFANFHRRRERHVYVSQWYILGAAFWMPLIYITSQWLCVEVPARGVVQASVNWWYAHNVLGLWVTPFGLAAAYYLIPKVIGRPVYSYYLSIIGFWSLALFYSWAGMHHLIGGPMPAWMISASIAGSVMMLIPVGAVAVNHHFTMKGHFRELRYSPTLRFVVFGAMAYTVVSVQGSIESLRRFSEVAHFTQYTIAHAHLGLYGFLTMVMFGAGYYMIPRLTGREWAATWLIQLHFWSTAVGIATYFVALTYGGWYQGLDLINADVKFIEIVVKLKSHLVHRSAAGCLMTFGHIMFAILVVMNLMGYGKPLGAVAAASENKP